MKPVGSPSASRLPFGSTLTVVSGGTSMARPYGGEHRATPRCCRHQGHVRVRVCLTELPFPNCCESPVDNNEIAD
jgi:hypothetical protein